MLLTCACMSEGRGQIGLQSRGRMDLDTPFVELHALMAGLEGGERVQPLRKCALWLRTTVCGEVVQPCESAG